jgi:hypothetical protein
VSQFQSAGLSQSDIDQIGSQQLTDAQLALVFMTINKQVHAAVASNGTTGTPGSAGGGWSDAWAQKFAALGLTPQEMAQVQQAVQQTGGGDAAIQAIYANVAQNIQAAQAQSQQQGSQTQGNTPPTNGAGKPGGWNATWQTKFAALGMPADVIKTYAQANAQNDPQQAYDFAAKRLAAFKQGGWMARYQKDGFSADDIWQRILSPTPLTDKQMLAECLATEKAHRPKWESALQLGVSFLPGGELAQYAVGHKFVTGVPIRQSSPWEMALAGASALLAIKGAHTLIGLHNGWKAASEFAANKGALRDMPEMLRGLAANPETTDAARAMLTARADSLDEVLSGVRTWGNGAGRTGKLMSLLPYTAQHKNVMGIAQAASAAKVFNSERGAAAILARQNDGIMAVDTLGQRFQDIASGAVQVRGAGNNWVGHLSFPFKRMKTDPYVETKIGGRTVLTGNKAVNYRRGDQVLAALLETADPNPSLVTAADNIPAADQQLHAVGRYMSQNVARTVGATHRQGINGLLDYVKPGMTQHFIENAKNNKIPQWYDDLAHQADEGALTGGVTPAVADPVTGDAAGAAAAAGDDAHPTPTGPAGGGLAQSPVAGLMGGSDAHPPAPPAADPAPAPAPFVPTAALPIPGAGGGVGYHPPTADPAEAIVPTAPVTPPTTAEPFPGYAADSSRGVRVGTIIKDSTVERYQREVAELERKVAVARSQDALMHDAVMREIMAAPPAKATIGEDGKMHMPPLNRQTFQDTASEIEQELTHARAKLASAIERTRVAQVADDVHGPAGAAAQSGGSAAAPLTFQSGGTVADSSAQLASVAQFLGVDPKIVS